LQARQREMQDKLDRTTMNREQRRAAKKQQEGQALRQGQEQLEAQDRLARREKQVEAERELLAKQAEELVNKKPTRNPLTASTDGWGNAVTTAAQRAAAASPRGGMGGAAPAAVADPHAAAREEADLAAAQLLGPLPTRASKRQRELERRQEPDLQWSSLSSGVRQWGNLQAPPNDGFGRFAAGTSGAAASADDMLAQAKVAAAETGTDSR
jgi:hypothetical protein